EFVPGALVAAVDARLRSGSATPGETAGVGLVAGFDDDLVQVHVRGAARGEGDDFGDVLGDERVDTFIDLRGALGVTGEPDYGEFRFHRAGCDLGEADRLPEQFTAQGAVQHGLGVFGGGVAGAVVVGVERGDGGDGDDQAVAGGDEFR